MKVKTPSEIQERIAAIIGEDPNETLEKLRASSEVWARLKTSTETFSDRRRAFLARIIEHKREIEPGMSDKKLEAWAMSTEEYRGFLKKGIDELETFHKIDREYRDDIRQYDYLMKLMDFAKAETYLTRS